MNSTPSTIYQNFTEVQYIFDYYQLLAYSLVWGILGFITGRIFEDESKERANRRP